MARTNGHSKPRVLTDAVAWKDWAASAAKIQDGPRGLIVDWAAKVWAGPYGLTVKLLLTKGCKPLPLLELMYASSLEWDRFSAKRKEELNDVQKRIVALTRRLESDSKELLVLSGRLPLLRSMYLCNSNWGLLTAKRREKLDRRTFHMETEGFLRCAAASLLVFARELQATEELVARLRKLRKTQSFCSIAPLWFYCHAATGAKVSDREIADLVNAAQGSVLLEGSVRMGRKRFKQTDPDIYEFLKTWTEQYVADCPDGTQSITEWSPQHPLRRRPTQQ